jgi:hypothetical protein
MNLFGANDEFLNQRTGRMQQRSRNGSSPHSNKRRRKRPIKTKDMKVNNMTLTRTPSLEDRIRQIRIDVEAIIDAKAEAVARESPGVPLGVIRSLLTARAPACPCAQYLEISGSAAK